MTDDNDTNEPADFLTYRFLKRAGQAFAEAQYKRYEKEICADMYFGMIGVDHIPGSDWPEDQSERIYEGILYHGVLMPLDKAYEMENHWYGLDKEDLLDDAEVSRTIPHNPVEYFSILFTQMDYLKLNGGDIVWGDRVPTPEIVDQVFKDGFFDDEDADEIDPDFISLRDSILRSIEALQRQSMFRVVTSAPSDPNPT